MLSLCVCEVIVCDKVVWREEEEEAGGGGTRIQNQNKNPTQRCGEILGNLTSQKIAQE